jgi:hypothetical protein
MQQIDDPFSFLEAVVGSDFHPQRGGKGSGHSRTGYNKLEKAEQYSCSDGFEAYLQGPQVDKRNRSDTVSTVNSDKYDSKRHKLYTRVDSIL